MEVGLATQNGTVVVRLAETVPRFVSGIVTTLLPEEAGKTVLVIPFRDSSVTQIRVPVSDIFRGFIQITTVSDFFYIAIHQNDWPGCFDDDTSQASTYPHTQRKLIETCCNNKSI